MDADMRKDEAHGADGEAVWSWRLDAGVKLATMLGIALAMVTRKPDHQREHEGNRNAIAQGMPDCSGEPVVTNSCAFYLCARGCGCS